MGRLGSPDGTPQGSGPVDLRAVWERGWRPRRESRPTRVDRARFTLPHPHPVDSGAPAHPASPYVRRAVSSNHRQFSPRIWVGSRAPGGVLTTPRTPWAVNPEHEPTFAQSEAGAVGTRSGRSVGFTARFGFERAPPRCAGRGGQRRVFDRGPDGEREVGAWECLEPAVSPPTLPRPSASSGAADQACRRVGSRDGVPTAAHGTPNIPMPRRWLSTQSCVPHGDCDQQGVSVYGWQRPGSEQECNPVPGPLCAAGASR